MRYLPDFGYSAQVLTTSAFGGREDKGVLRAWEPLKAYRWLFKKGLKLQEAVEAIEKDGIQTEDVTTMIEFAQSSARGFVRNESPSQKE